MTQEPLLPVIRTAAASDAEQIQAVYEAAFQPLRSIYRPTGATARRQVQRAMAGTRLVAEHDGQIIATVQFDSHADHLHVIGLAVHPQHQRSGIAGRLLDHISDLAPSHGHHKVVLDTIAETGNVPIFQRLGFRESSRHRTTDFSSETHRTLYEVKMERPVKTNG